MKRLIVGLYRRRSWLAYSILAGITAILGCDIAVSLSADLYRDAKVVPQHDIALVLGTAPRYANKPNSFYVARIKAAADLYAAGAVKGILVSGDHGRPEYNEPDQMKKDLVAKGVPAEFITCDYAGFSTSDSIVRAEAIFGLKRFIVVSQGFHAERAVFIARNLGLEATAFAADDAPLKPHLKIRSREVLSRCLAVANLAWPREPRHLGPKLNLAMRR